MTMAKQTTKSAKSTKKTAPRPPQPTSNDPGSGAPKRATQLRLLPSGTGRLEWSLDERTRTVGRQGVAQAREILRRHQPPQPVDAWSKAS
jgi:hypothetical protein